MTGEASTQTTKFKFQVLFKIQYERNRRGGKIMMGKLFSYFGSFQLSVSVTMKSWKNGDSVTLTYCACVQRPNKPRADVDANAFSSPDSCCRKREAGSVQVTPWAWSGRDKSQQEGRSPATLCGPAGPLAGLAQLWGSFGMWSLIPPISSFENN